MKKLLKIKSKIKIKIINKEFSLFVFGILLTFIIYILSNYNDTIKEINKEEFIIEYDFYKVFIMYIIVLLIIMLLIDLKKNRNIKKNILVVIGIIIMIAYILYFKKDLTINNIIMVYVFYLITEVFNVGLNVVKYKKAVNYIEYLENMRRI
ncbi:hypothetical protein [Oceanivirga salmonicida]|uniref:hypothetical protein n=1 Tax=Oceanivirga salmonicida TaxID=1769291 RepID=UPI0008336217|nr:hypothetical protein [Oceanivirga salmonicida]